MSYEAAVLADNPVRYFRMNTTAARDEVSGTNLTFVGTTPTLATGLHANMGSCWQLNTNAHINLAGTTNYVSDNSFSIEFWLKTPTTGFGGAWTTAWWMSGGGSTSALQIQPGGVIAPHLGGVGQPTSVKAVNDNVWHHIVWAINGTGTGSAKLYIDGGLDSTGNNPGSLGSGATYHTILRLPSDANSGVIGLIDEFAIYPTALSDGRIMAHYLSATAVSTATPFRGWGVPL